MKVNDYKPEFARICSVWDGVPAGASECECYGMCYGCDGDCPVFVRGECKLEDIESFRKQIKDTDRFSGWTTQELNRLYPQLNLQ